MDVLGVTKSILSGNDSHSWIQSILMTEDDKRKLIRDIDKLTHILLNSQEKIRLRKLINSKTKDILPFCEVNNALARNSLQTSSKKLVESYIFNGELNFDSLEYMSGKMILNYEFDRAITSLKAGREARKSFSYRRLSYLVSEHIHQMHKVDAHREIDFSLHSIYKNKRKLHYLES